MSRIEPDNGDHVLLNTYQHIVGGGLGREREIESLLLNKLLVVFYKKVS